MMHQKPWFHLLIHYITIAVLCCCGHAQAWQHSKNNNNPLSVIIQQALEAHGILFLDDLGVPLKDPPPPNNVLEYPIFHGKSALRSLPDSCRTMVQRELNDDDDDDDDSKKKTKVALLLLSAGYGDAAHDVLLGTTFGNLEQAEYAATHRGQTNWAQEHPLSDWDDVLHSIIHRICEGNRTGEGGYTGNENAQYWCAGGPKQYSKPIASFNQRMINEEEEEVTYYSTTTVLGKVYQSLCQLALERAPICVSRGIVAQTQESKPTADKVDTVVTKGSSSSSREGGGTRHSIIAGGGKFRQVFVPEGCWDPIAFCQLLLENETTDVKDKMLQSELEYLTQKELELMTKYLRAWK